MASNSATFANISDVNPALGMDGAPDLLYGEDAIERMIGNVLGIAPGERWWWPNFALDLRRYMFTILTPATATTMQIEIDRALRHNIPFITAVPLVKPDFQNQQYVIQVSWQVSQQQSGVYNATLGVNSIGGNS